MKNLNLFDAAQKRVSMIISVPAEIDKAVKKTYGLDRASIKSLHLNDSIFNGIERARENGMLFYKSATNKLDPINEMAATSLRSASVFNSTMHPLDDFFSLIKSEVKSDNHTRKPINKKDEINAFTETTFGSSKKNHTGKPINDSDEINAVAENIDVSSPKPNHSPEDIKALLKNIYTFYCSGEKLPYKLDPINDVAASEFGAGHFPVNPVHTLNQWNALIDEILDQDPESIFSATDTINDEAAKAIGYQGSSSKKMEIIQDKLLSATYLLAYKLTPGSADYKNKATEIEQLKAARNKLQDNLNKI